MFARAWLSPAIEGLAVIQMKLDPIRGAEDIESFLLHMQIIGALIACSFGGYVMTQTNV